MTKTPAEQHSMVTTYQSRRILDIEGRVQRLEQRLDLASKKFREMQEAVDELKKALEAKGGNDG